MLVVVDPHEVFEQSDVPLNDTIFMLLVRWGRRVADVPLQELLCEYSSKFRSTIRVDL